MGSINCKEYVTTANNDSCANQAAGSGASGSYQSTSEANMSDEYTDPVTVCKEQDIRDNEMKQLQFDDNTKILLIKQNGRLTAIGNKCSHYGAPLHTGSLGQGRVRCPWHGACFNIKTGDIEDFPGLDSIPCYQVQVADGQVKVRAKRKDLESNKRLKNMVKRIEKDERCYVIVGGGPAGAVCAETLRQEGFTGRIVMICRETNLPYDRVKVSKSMDAAVETLQFRDAAFYAEHGIETMLGIEATKLDTTKRTVLCSNGFSIKFEKIFIATGCRSAKPPIPGADLRQVHTIRDWTDSNAIVKALRPEMNVVCLGSSFVALEAAAFLVNKVKTVSVIGRENVPFKASFGEQIGERVLQLYRNNNVDMHMKSGIVEIFDDGNGQVKEVQLLDGTILPCDLLIMGTGSTFYTDFVRESGVGVNHNGSIDVDIHLMTNVMDVYVGGDIANAPVYAIGNDRATIGHYQMAQYHGSIAAINMVGAAKKELHAVPFFFTTLFGKGFRYAGYGKFTSVVIEGDLADLKFVQYFLDQNDYVVAVASCGRDPVVAQFADLLYQGKRLRRSEIENTKDSLAWTEQLKDPATCSH